MASESVAGAICKLGLGRGCWKVCLSRGVHCRGRLGSLFGELCSDEHNFVALVANGLFVFEKEVLKVKEWID